MFPVDKTGVSLERLVKQVDATKSLEAVVNGVTLEKNFEDFKKDLNFTVKQEGEKILKKVYCAIHAIKELACEKLWFEVKGGLANYPGKHDIYLLDHVIHGHLLGPHTGERSLKSHEGKSKYFDEDCQAWRTDDFSRSNPLFIIFFLHELSRTFADKVTYKNVEIQDKEDGRFNIVLYTNYKKGKMTAIDVDKCLFGQMYLNPNTELGEKIPEVNMYNSKLTSITLMVDSDVAPKQAKIQLPQSEIEESAVSIIFPHIYQSPILFLPGLFHKLVEFLGLESTKQDKRKQSKTTAISSPSALMVSTLWPEFASVSEIGVESREDIGIKEKLHLPPDLICSKASLPAFRSFSKLEQKMGYVDTGKSLNCAINNQATRVRIINVKHDGNCGYYSLGLTREQAAELLRKGLDSEEKEHVISLIAPEIAHRVVSNTLPDNMMKDSIRNILKKKDLIETRRIQVLSNRVKYYLSEKAKGIDAQNMKADVRWRSDDNNHTILNESGEGYTHDELVKLVRTFRNRTKDMDDLIFAHEKVELFNSQLIEYSKKEETVSEYINLFVDVDPENFKTKNPLLLKEHADENNWLDVNHQSGIADALAYLMQSNLVIINGRKGKDFGNIVHEYRREDAIKTIILILNGNLYMRGEQIARKLESV